MKQQLVVTVFSEIFRRELDRAEAELQRDFADAGRASGARKERFAEAAREAQLLTEAAINGLDL